MLFISFFLCVFCSHQLVPSWPWCCLLFNFSKDLSYPKI
jgi:hypothetical protein